MSFELSMQNLIVGTSKLRELRSRLSQLLAKESEFLKEHSFLSLVYDLPSNIDKGF